MTNHTHCDICHKPCMMFALFGLMSWKKRLNPAVRVCDKCTDTAPCGLKGYWNDGQLTCPHGYKFEVHADWVNEEQAILKWRLVDLTWWRAVKEMVGLVGHK